MFSQACLAAADQRTYAPQRLAIKFLQHGGVTLLWHNASPNAQRLVLLPEGPRMMVPASPTCFACYSTCLGRYNSLLVSYTQEDMLCGVLAAGEQRTSGTRR